jgi:Uma2 family endonuclease
MALVVGFRHRMTYADLEQMPADGRRYELYDGEARLVPAPIPLHQLVVQRFASALEDYRLRHGGLVFFSPIDIVFSEFDCAQPDVVFFHHTRKPLIDLRKPIRVAPDLTAEVLSPGTARIDRGKKKQMFAAFGVREYWLLDPDARTIEVYGLVDGMYVRQDPIIGSNRVGSAVLPEFALDVDWLFAFE